MAIDDYRIVSDIHPVYWAGFHSDTRTLQQAGWEFSMHQNIEYDRMGLAMRHPAFGMVGLSHGIPYMNLMDRPSYNTATGQRGHPFEIHAMFDHGAKFRTIDVPEGIDRFQPVDMQPQIWHETTIREMSFEDLNIFAGVQLARTQQLIVDPNDVSAMMDRILELQDPARKERYKNMVREAKRAGNVNRAAPRQNFHAQIVSLVA